MVETLKLNIGGVEYMGDFTMGLWVVNFVGECIIAIVLSCIALVIANYLITDYFDDRDKEKKEDEEQN